MTKQHLGLELVSNMEVLTGYRINDLALKNADQNERYLDQGNNLKELRNITLGNNDTALIIAAGPSIKFCDVTGMIKEYDYKGAIICSDSSLLYCLRNDIIPDLVVTLDPHGSRIVRWFGDPELSEHKLEKDDYFSRQDLDTSFRRELKVNEEILGYLDKYGKQIKIALSTSSAPEVVDRVINSGMEIYWWNPMFDDPSDPESITRKLIKRNHLPCLNAAGNVGSACWMMAHAVLGKHHVALTGMDFSYYKETPYRNTQYYYEAIDLVGEENLADIYIDVHNPFINKDYYTDPAYMWYRECFLKLAAKSDCVTYNCTEGGILFGEGIHFVPLNVFLSGDAFKPKASMR